MTQPILEDAQSTFSGTREVDPRHALDEAALDQWLRAHVEGYAGPLTLRQFKGGQSNPTYELVTPTGAYVLRRKPPGTLLPSAHAVDREFTVISALHRQGYPVARPWALCTDDSVIGSMFYVMDKVEGRVLWDLKLPGMEPARRRAIYESQVDTLATLHAFKPDQGSVDRLDLARWIVSQDNPVTARVIANRVWHHLFGRGLAATPDNLGHLGPPPSHPALADNQ